jgi:hypothetical protein
VIREIEETLGQELPRCTVPGVKPYKEWNRKKTIKGREKLKRRLL